MKYYLHITQIAERDFSQAADYIEFVLKNPQAADNLLAEAEKRSTPCCCSPKNALLWKINFLLSGVFVS